jgi:hypothetical protein
MDNKQPQLPYNGTGGYVNRPASKERAVREAKDGTLSARQQAVLQELLTAGPTGATWKSIGYALNLHHGQVSGALSNLHKAGLVFMLRVKRYKCHPYVAAQYRQNYTDAQVWDKPAQTRAGERRQLLEQLLAQCYDASVLGWSNYHCTEISRIVDRVIAHDGAATSQG